MADLVIKPATGLGNRLVVKDQGGTAVITTADSGATVANATLTAPTVADMSNCTFPAGHVIRSWYTQDDGGEHAVADPSDANKVYSELDLSITGTNNTSNFLLVTIFLASVNNGFTTGGTAYNYYGNSLQVGCRYSTDDWGSPSHGADLTSDTYIGGQNAWSMSGAVDSGEKGARHGVSVTFRVNHPTTATYRIRPYLTNNGSACSFNKGQGTSTMTALEIKG